MPTNYPDGTNPAYPAGLDVFNEPLVPEQTTLSASGGGTRNHVEHHTDLGDAVEALQRNTSLKGHDHSGTDPLNPSTKLKQVNTHQNADTDTGASAIHHTLGPGPGQAATGNHIHDYNGPTIINQPYLLCTSTTRPLNPAKGTMIYEQDTNRVRAWSTFQENVTVTGLSSQDDFSYPNLYKDTANRPSLRPTDWKQWYADDPADTDHGAMGVTVNGFASWIDQGSDNNRCIARRINPTDATTQTDDQVITWKTGNIGVELDWPLTEPASNDFFFRMSSENPVPQSYLRLQVGQAFSGFTGQGFVALFYTKTGPGGEIPLGQLNSIDVSATNAEWSAQLKDRTVTIYRLGELMGTIKDTAAVSAKGAAFRGWGTGMEAGDRLGGQSTPANIDFVKIQDMAYYSTANRWTLLPVAAVPVCRIRQSKTQQLVAAGTIIQWQEEIEDTFQFFDAAVSQTDIRIKEAGIYQLELGIQWNPNVVPDVAGATFMINGVETTTKAQEFIRGNTFNPGFSQTLTLSGKLRFAVNDLLQVKVSYTAPNSLLGQIFSYFEPSSKINSRLDVHFMSP